MGCVEWNGNGNGVGMSSRREMGVDGPNEGGCYLWGDRKYLRKWEAVTDEMDVGRLGWSVI